jgi:hypothetical protein
MLLFIGSHVSALRPWLPIYNYDHRTRDPKHWFKNYEAVETECRLADCSCILGFLMHEVDG